MPPKNKTANKDSSNCNLCCRPIVENKDESIQCEGQCRLTFHRYCAGVSVTHHKQFATSSARPFVCMVCNQALQNERVLQLVAEVEHLKAELAVTKELLAKERQLCKNYPTVSTSDSEGEQQQESSRSLEGNSNRWWSSAVKRKTVSTSAPKSGGNSVLKY